MHPLQPRQNLLSAAGRIGEASQDVMNEVGETAGDLDKIFQVNQRLEIFQMLKNCLVWEDHSYSGNKYDFII